MKKPFLFLARHSRLLIGLFLISFLAGCIGSKASSGKVWKDIKASELISRQQPPENKSMAAGLRIYLFRIQMDKLTEIQEQISQTNTVPLKYSDSGAFSANGFIGCAGDRTSWQKLAELLIQSQPEIKKRINLLIAEDIPDDIIIAETSQPVSVVYRSGSTTTGIGFDAGRIALRIQVKPLIGLRQSCGLDVTPVYKTGTGRKTKKQFISRRNYDFAFESASFNVRLRPGQFVLLAPATTELEQTGAQTIGDIMFYSQNPQNTAALYLIACNLVNSSF